MRRCRESFEDGGKFIQRKPSRPIPVSTLKMQACRWFPRAAAFSSDYVARAPNTVGVSFRRDNLAFLRRGQKPVINRMRDRCPPREAESPQIERRDAQPARPSSRNAREHSPRRGRGIGLHHAQTVTPAPACLYNGAKVLPEIGKGNFRPSGGAVATRLGISTVVATEVDYSGSGAAPQVTLGLLPPVSSFPVSGSSSRGVGPETGNLL